MWIPILLCLAALALFLGPVMLMQPTPSQRREAKLRKKALDLGLRVHLQPLPKDAGTETRSKMIAAYCLPWENSKDANNVWILVKTKYSHGLHFSGPWDWEREAEGGNLLALQQSLEAVPERVVAIASGPQGLCCYWDELGGEQVLEDIANWLKATAPTLQIRRVVRAE